MESAGKTLAASERRFRAIVALAADAIICVDASQRIIEFNDGAERLFGYARAEISGQSIDRLIPPRFHASHGRHVANFAAGPPSARLMGDRRAIYAIRRDGTEFAAQATISKIEEAGDFVLTVILRDVSEQKSAEAQLEARVADRTRALETEILGREKAQAQLVRAQRMEAYGQLTGGIAHDFNNLLTVIAGNLELLGDTALDARQKTLVRRALDGSGMGARLTQRLLTFARRGGLAPVYLDLNAEVSNVVELLRRTLGETILVSTALAPAIWTIRADPSEVESAIVNLAINARDAMPEGGALAIETANVTINEDAAAMERHEELSTGQYVRLSVSDTGTGMAPEVLQRAFEPFFTTKGPGRGTGLGLATIYGFAKQSSGHLTIDSEPARGTTVCLYLPKAETAAEVARAPGVAAATSLEGAATILVVEDNAGVRVLAVERLEKFGFNALSCASGAEAIAQVQSGAKIDLVFSDVVMAGGMSGYDVAAWMAANRPAIPVLLTSGFAEAIVFPGGGAPAGVTLLRKPYSRTDLFKAISGSLKGPANL